MRKRTTVNVDVELLREAQAEFGTHTATSTIDVALREALALKARIRLARRDLPGLTAESLERMREGRLPAPNADAPAISEGGHTDALKVNRGAC